MDAQGGSRNLVRLAGVGDELEGGEQHGAEACPGCEEQESGPGSEEERRVMPW
jgi:hypothetical protein